MLDYIILFFSTISIFIFYRRELSKGFDRTLSSRIYYIIDGVSFWFAGVWNHLYIITMMILYYALWLIPVVFILEAILEYLQYDNSITIPYLVLTPLPLTVLVISFARIESYFIVGAFLLFKDCSKVFFGFIRNETTPFTGDVNKSFKSEGSDIAYTRLKTRSAFRLITIFCLPYVICLMILDSLGHLTQLPNIIGEAIAPFFPYVTWIPLSNVIITFFSAIFENEQNFALTLTISLLPALFFIIPTANDLRLKQLTNHQRISNMDKWGRRKEYFLGIIQITFVLIFIILLGISFTGSM